MRRSLLCLLLFLLFGSLGSALAQQQPKIRYIMPDVGTPGMNTYIEVIAPVDVIGGYGAQDTLYSSPTIEMRVANAADTARLIFSPCLVSWDARMVSCQVFVRPSVTGPFPIAVPVQIVRVANNQTYASNVDTFYIVQPQTFGAKSGGGMIGSGGGMGTRSRRGAMIVDSMILGSGTYTIDTSDTDPGTGGNQGFLPVVILSKGRIVVSSDAVISAGAYGKNGGPGGGGGGGYGSSRTGLVTIPGEVDAPLGSGFVGGKSSIPLIGSPGGFGSSSGRNDSSLNGVAVHPFTAGGRWLSAGPGHPFDSSGQSGGAVAVTGSASPPVIVAIGGGGNATAGGGAGSAVVHGGAVGNAQIIPLHGGSGGAGGASCDSVGGGGGGGIALYSNRDVVISTVSARGGRGRNGLSTNSCSTLRGDPSGGGAGGCIIVGGKLGVRLSAADVSGGAAGTASGTSTATADSGGAGRFRNDGRFAGTPSVTASASRYSGPTMDTLTFADSANWTVRGTGRTGDSIFVYVRGESSPWNFGNPFRTTVRSDSTWQVRILFPFDSVAYLFAVQRCSVPAFMNMYAKVPTFAFSQAAASVVRLTLLPSLDAPSTRRLDSLFCPTFRYDTIVVRNRGTGPLVLGTGSAFTGTNAALYTLTSPALPDTVPPLDSVKLIYRFNGTTPAQGTLGTTFRLLTNDPVAGHGTYDIAINLFKELRSFSVREARINLGGIYVGTSKDTGAIYRNLNSYRDSIVSISIIAGPSIVRQTAPLPLPHSTAAHDSTALLFSVTPRDTGTFTIQLKVTSRPCDKDTVITITGFGRSGVIASAKSWGITGQSCDDTTEQSFPIRNVGNAPLTIDYPSFDPSGNSGFSILSPPQSSFPVIVQPGDSLMLKIRVVNPSGALLSNRLRFSSSDSLAGKNPLLVDLVADREAASLSLPDSVIDLGMLCIGDDPAYSELHLRNNAQKTIARILAIDRADSSAPFTIVSPSSTELPADILPQADGVIGIRFAPTAPGIYVDTLTLHADPCARSIRVILRATGVAATIRSDVPTVSFGDVRVGTPARRTVTLRNTSTTGTTVAIDGLGLRPPDPQLRIVWPTIPPTKDLAPGDTVQVVIEYTPGAAGPLPEASLCAHVSSPCRDSICNPIEGNGITSAVASSRASLALVIPACGGDDGTEDTLSLSNLGTAPVDVIGITASPSSFTVIGTTTFTLAGGSSRSVRVRFTAPGSGTITGTLTVTTTDPQRPTITIPLTGRRDTAHVAFGSRTIAFDTAYSCALPARASIRIVNDGSLPDTVRSAIFTPPFDMIPPPPFIIPAGRDTTVTITFNPGTDGAFTGRGIIAGGPCDIADTVTLTGIRSTPVYRIDAVDFGDVPIVTLATGYAVIHNPTSATIRVASAVITPANGSLSIAPGQFPLRVPPRGTASIAILFTPAVAGPIPAGTKIEAVIDSACNGTISAEIAGQGVEGSLIANRGALLFGKVLSCRSATDSVVIRNSGVAATTINGVSIDPSLKELDQTTSTGLPKTLNPGDSIVIRVTFTPSAPPDGPISTTLKIATDDPKRPEVDVQIRGERISQSIAFGGATFTPIPVTSSQSRSGWIVNDGTAPVRITAVATSVPFSVAGTSPGLPATLEPGDSLRVDLTFEPRDPGAFTGDLSISGTDLCADLPHFPLTATATTAVVITASWPEVSGQPGQNITIPLTISGDVTAADVTEYTLGARFDRTMLIPTRVILDGTLSDGWRITSQRFAPGSVEFSATGSRPLAGSGTLALIEMRVALGDSTATAITATDSSSFRTDRATLKITPGLFRLEGYCQSGDGRLIRVETGFGLRSVRPNPVGTSADIGLDLVEEGRTTLMLVDLLGGTVLPILDREMKPGSYTLSFSTAGVPNGVYFLELRTPAGRDLRRITVAH